MNVTLQYFDGCPNWKVTKGHLEALIDEGHEMAIGYRLIDTPELADELGFRGSPTVLIDGVDPFADPDAPVGLSCRVYRTAEGVEGSPTLEQLRVAVTAAS